jgi:hypothetical protein
MRTGWVEKIGPFPVERRPMGQDYGAVDLNSPPKGCGHTTEGNSEVPNYGSAAPQFTVGKVGIYQHRALGRMAGTLRHPSGTPPTNGVVRIQYEMVGFSSVKPWVPPDKQADMLTALYEFAKKECDIPEDHVWPDELSETPLASGQIWASESNPRRKQKFPGTPGWYFHLEVPNNSHWDKGSCLVTPLMKRQPLPAVVTAFAFVIRERQKDGTSRSDEVSPFFSERKALREWAVGEKDKLRSRIWDAMVAGHVHVAERRVRAEDVSA